MCKKSLRVAIDLHVRLLDGRFGCGSYGDAVGDDRKAIFSKELDKLEPELSPCPFCGVLPIYHPSTLSGYGLTSGGGGWSAYITCDECDLEFKGGNASLIRNWNDRSTKNE